MRLRITLLALLLLVAGGAAAWWWRAGDASVSSRPALELTGSIEARTVALAPEVGGRVLEVLVEEGQDVRAGQPLVRLDGAWLQLQRAQAEAARRAAEANLRLLEAGARPEELRAAQARLEQAIAGLRLARARLDGAAGGARPEVVGARSQALDRALERYLSLTAVLDSDQTEAIRTAARRAESNLAEAEARQQDLAGDARTAARWIASARAAVERARLASEAGDAAYRAARARDLPSYLQIQLAREAWDEARYGLALARVWLVGAEADARSTPEALDAARTTVEDVERLVEAAREAHEALTSGPSFAELEAAWQEVQGAREELAAVAGRPSALVLEEASEGASEGASPPAPALPLAEGAPSIAQEASAATEGFQTTQVPRASLEALLAQIDAASSQQALAAANLDALEAGAHREAVEAARAQLEAARAPVELLDLQIERLVLRAPWDGVVLARSAEPGQLAAAGSTLFELGRLDPLELSVYLPEQRFGRLSPGDEVRVRVDAYPGRVFVGTVLRLADEAFFTPSNVQTREDRARLVYAATIGLDNPDRALKPGMIADVEVLP